MMMYMSTVYESPKSKFHSFPNVQNTIYGNFLSVDENIKILL